MAASQAPKSGKTKKKQRQKPGDEEIPILLSTPEPFGKRPDPNRGGLTFAVCVTRRQ
jgi:hypothetical protein